MSQAPALPPDLFSLADHAALARQRLSPLARAYIDGGAENGLTLAANTAAWQQRELLPRLLRGLGPENLPDTALTLLGRPLEWPLLVAPMAYQRLAHADGEWASALAAQAQGAGFCLATQASVSVETVAQALGPERRAPLWFQLYGLGERPFAAELAERAQAAGCDALLVTLDAPVQGVRDDERRHAAAWPAGLRAAHLRPGQPPPTAPATWDDLAWLTAHSRLPVVAKGILHPADARLALEAGAAAIVVSNHGGRTLDTALPTARALPAVAQAVQGAVPVLVDGGIRRGSDLLKALALGASAALLGRPVLHGLANAGPLGAAHVLRLLRDEFTAALILCGCRSLADCADALAT